MMPQLPKQLPKLVDLAAHAIVAKAPDTLMPKGFAHAVLQ
jgi:hypothetical protein